MASYIIITAIVCVLITTVAVIVSFATPNWVKFENVHNSVCQCTTCDCGMWLLCQGDVTSDGSIDNCAWFFSDEYRIEKALPDWYKAVQGLMSCAVVTSLISLLIGLFSLCCFSNSCDPHRAAAAFVSLTFLLITVAVCVFGGKGHLDYGINIMAEDGLNELSIFSWSFWVAVGAAGMALISSILYFCIGRSEEYV